ncbi:unnamed protein product [Calypogeia fissa]
MEAWSSDGGLKVLVIQEKQKQDPAERAQNLDNCPDALGAAADPCAASHASGSLVVWSTVQHHCPPMLKSHPRRMAHSKKRWKPSTRSSSDITSVPGRVDLGGTLLEENMDANCL